MTEERIRFLHELKFGEIQATHDAFQFILSERDRYRKALEACRDDLNSLWYGLCHWSEENLGIATERAAAAFARVDAALEEGDKG